MSDQISQPEPVKRAPIPEPDGTRPVSPPKPEEFDTYNFVADKIGFVPNVRKSDNALQAKVFLGVWAACVLIGAILGRGDGALTGLFLGIVVALVISGGVLAVVGLKRRS